MDNLKTVAVVGLGYVGLPLALELSKTGMRVIGIDINLDRLSLINSRSVNLEGISSRDAQIAPLPSSFELTSDFKVVSECNAVFICVPTPLTPGRSPDLSYLLSAVVSVAKRLKPFSLVVIESTVAPGTTRNTILPLLERESGLSESEIKIAFSPERIDPGNAQWRIDNTPRLVAGYTTQAAEEAKELYSQVVKDIRICSTLEVAETAKLLENSFRFINISFINELTIFCKEIGIDVNEVIKAAATKPYGFMPFYPSVGVGGHCIPVDPIYLSTKAREVGAPTKFIDLADEVNRMIPLHYVDVAAEKMGGLVDKKVLVIGVAYKPNVADVRETPVAALINGLRGKGAQVEWHDELVKEWNGETSVPISDSYSLAIIATHHLGLDLDKLGATPILDTKGSI
jgi:UDP-N-acetyl-D-glucosamine dehydrogenase